MPRVTAAELLAAATSAKAGTLRRSPASARSGWGAGHVVLLGTGPTREGQRTCRHQDVRPHDGSALVLDRRSHGPFDMRNLILISLWLRDDGPAPTDEKALPRRIPLMIS